MKVENNAFNYTLGHVQQLSRVDAHDANKMSCLMSDSSSDKSISSTQKSTDSVTQAKAKTKAIKEWYKTLKRTGNFSATTLNSTLEGAFSSSSEKKEALWYAFSQEKSAKSTDKSSPELLGLLEQELLGSFSSRLLAEPPKDRQELKALLSEYYRLGAQKEQALWHSWAELKDIPEQAPVLEMVRKELSFVIQKNAMVKNMLTYSYKLELS